MADNFFVTAIIVSHDGATWLPEAIASTSAQTRQIDRIIAVDTGSLDNSVKMLRNAGLSVIRTERDAGFGDAIALALGSAKKIKGKEQEELIWILHDDCAPTRNALEILISGLVDKPDVAFVGPKLCGWYDRKHLLEVGISIAVNGARWTGLDPRERDQGQYDKPAKVLAVSTAAMLARREIFEDLGGLDPNLALFRDDVDLGWRARVAGYSVMSVPEALVYHAEAAATERRSVDVEEAFLHRPRLLDRKNAAFVLLVNASWWLLPWVALQIVGSAIIRAIGYLAAKLPGYATDEIAAVGLLIIKPRDLIVGRKLRRSKRLLSPRVVREFIPPPGSQIRLAIEQASYSLRKYFKAPANTTEELDDSMSYSDIGVIDESFENQDLVVKPNKANWQTLRNRPLLLGLTVTFVISIIASRNRFGNLSGGALSASPEGAMELISKYGETWHLVGLGSAAATPPWVAVLGIASALTLGKVWLFLTILFLLTPPLAFFAMYRSGKRLGLSFNFAVIGGLIYAMSPVIWNSINQGRIGTIIVTLLAPALVSVFPRTIKFEETGWRKIYGLTLLAALLSAFSSLFLIIWTLAFGALLIRLLIDRKLEITEFGFVKFLMGADLGRIKRVLAFLLIPGLLNAPWSASLILHPTKIFLNPGLPLTGGSLLNALTFNPGGETGVPAWITAPFLIYLIILFFSSRFRLLTSTAFILFGLAVILSQINIEGHGSTGRIWIGSTLIFIQILILIPTLQIASELIPKLRLAKLGFRHILSVLTVIFTLFSATATGLWVITSGANSLVSSNQSEIVPPFIASLSDTPARPKVLVIGKKDGQINFFITRGTDLEIGDADLSVAIPGQVKNAVVELVSGTGLASSKLLGAYGIQYLFFKKPVDEGVVRTIDGIGGFIRSSSTNSGIIWQVAASSPRVSFMASNGEILAINSGKTGAAADLKTPGSVILAEKFDSNWKLILNGNRIEVVESEIGLPTFTTTEAGAMILLHDGTRHRALISLQLIALLTIMVLSLPAGRRRREVPVEELA